jgi:hypothetical protein
LLEPIASSPDGGQRSSRPAWEEVLGPAVIRGNRQRRSDEHSSSGRDQAEGADSAVGLVVLVCPWLDESDPLATPSTGAPWHLARTDRAGASGNAESRVDPRELDPRELDPPKRGAPKLDPPKLGSPKLGALTVDSGDRADVDLDTLLCQSGDDLLECLGGGTGPGSRGGPDVDDLLAALASSTVPVGARNRPVIDPGAPHGTPGPATSGATRPDGAPRERGAIAADGGAVIDLPPPVDPTTPRVSRFAASGLDDDRLPILRKRR